MVKSVFLILLVTAACVARAQKVGFNQCDTAEIVHLKKGVTFLNTCDDAWVLNPPKAREIVGQHIKDSTALAVLEERVKLSNEIEAMQDSVIEHLKRIDSIQSASYALLHKSFEAEDGLVVRATNNTDKALAYIRRVKITGYITAGILGGTAGGMIGGQIHLDNGDRSGFSFSWPAAIGGVVVGCLVNGLIMDVIN